MLLWNQIKLKYCKFVLSNIVGMKHKLEVQWLLLSGECWNAFKCLFQSVLMLSGCVIER